MAAFTEQTHAEEEAVLYFDLLGFASLSTGKTWLDDAAKSLQIASAQLSEGGLFSKIGHWKRRYAISDSVFLTDPDPVAALRWGALLFRRLMVVSSAAERPVLSRGGLAWGDVKHVDSRLAPAGNLIGPTVVEAVGLEQSDLKGPRLFVTETMVKELRQRDSDLVRWLLRPTSRSGVWEILWLLPPDPAEIEASWPQLVHLGTRSLDFLRSFGGDSGYGKHYRALAILVGRCAERLAMLRSSGGGPTSLASLEPTKIFPRGEISDILANLSGVPYLDALTLRRLGEAVENPAPSG